MGMIFHASLGIFSAVLADKTAKKTICLEKTQADVNLIVVTLVF